MRTVNKQGRHPITNTASRFQQFLIGLACLAHFFGSSAELVTEGSLAAKFRKVRVDDRALSEKLAASGAQLIGDYTFILSGHSGYSYLIEGSTNLSNWGSIVTLTNPSGQVLFTDPAASNFLRRYYRARLIP